MTDTPECGFFLAMGSSVAAEILARTGISWLCIDLQHGMIGTETAIQILQSLGTSDITTLVRVGSLDGHIMGKMLDAGANGIVVPSVNRRLDADQAIAACHYPPLGVRSIGPTRARLLNRDYVRTANDRVAIFLMIETAEGLASFDEIVAAPGLTGVLVGPGDLCATTGLVRNSTEYLNALERVVAGCRAASISGAIFADDENEARAYAKMGFTMIALGSDTQILDKGARDRLKAVRP
jgi:4-hydroxy-2-oxoheptanedioate aldolase